MARDIAVLEEARELLEGIIEAAPVPDEERELACIGGASEEIPHPDQEPSTQPAPRLRIQPGP